MNEKPKPVLTRTQRWYVQSISRQRRRKYPPLTLRTLLFWPPLRYVLVIGMLVLSGVLTATHPLIVFILGFLAGIALRDLYLSARQLGLWPLYRDYLIRWDKVDELLREER